VRSELTNNDFTKTSLRSLLTNKCGHITRTKPSDLDTSFARPARARDVYIKPSTCQKTMLVPCQLSHSAERSRSGMALWTCYCIRGSLVGHLRSSQH
jgi:hypothetical protein